MHQLLRTFLIIGAVFAAASVQNISLPLVVHEYESIYFVLLMNSIQFILITLIIALIIGKGKLGKIGNKKIIISIGVFNAITSILIVYSADTSRTPAIIQSILGSTNVIPSILFTKIILGKKVKYNLKFIIPSALLLAISLIISCIPVIESTFDNNTIRWICIYFIGILAGSLYNIMQEKYFINMLDSDVLDKLTLMVFVTLSQLIILIMMSWMEFVLGYTSHPVQAFIASFHTFGSDKVAIILLELFIIFNVITHLLCLYAVRISTNYTIIAITAAIPTIGVFFLIFPNLNEGVKYAWYEILPCIFCSIIAVILWLNGESHHGYEQSLIDKLINRYNNYRIVKNEEGVPLLKENAQINL